MKTFIILLIGSAISAIMGLLDGASVIDVENWVDWVPFGIGLTVFVLAHIGIIFFDLLGGIAEAIIDGISNP